MVIRFGVIGTNWISERFIAAGSEHQDFIVNGVYSRSQEKANEFAEKHTIKHTFTDLTEMAIHNEIDAVYIATPNSLHAKQAIICMENGKHVICEKPLASNQVEVIQMINKAKENNVVLMEAMKSTLMPNFLAVKENLHKIGTIRSYFSSNCRYSPSYDVLKNNELPNIFNPDLSGGSLMDLGVYTIYPLIDLFGKPQKIQAIGTIVQSGVDGQGHILLDFEEVKANVMFSCITQSSNLTEIHGEKGTIMIHHISSPKKAEIHYHDGTIKDISNEQKFEPMYYEIVEFIQLIQSNKTESSFNTWENSIITMEILDEARRQIGVKIR